jgi:hypothetical protein
VVYCKRPFGVPKQVLRYLARYTHRVAISNRRLIACDEKGVTFKWKDYRIEGPDRYKVMTLATHEFIRRFLIHVLPAGFQHPLLLPARQRQASRERRPRPRTQLRTNALQKNLYAPSFETARAKHASALAWGCNQAPHVSRLARKLLQTSLRRAAKSVFRLDFRFQAAEVFHKT